ncbi:hypothetical protein DJ021_18165 [Phenylobacterium hankyongense]|uniref:YdhG-like domain-containing protein n=1 Tax=Phenylobacterium hankyongense TaxID=1813876 RepID=A0A328B4U4_9CAUL|nr:DUF1801 domain-containing protein [Phenylobacterium hankyongense]RAK61585.1 hypothetical protein DJ021_18165 [Phenylobacterium hankyongense]
MDAEAQLEGFIAKYSDAVAAQIRAARARMRERLPGATELVYDNYNALAIGYGANDKIGGLVFSIAAYPRWVSLFFARGAALDDPAGRLKGEGSQVRHIVLTDLAVLDEPEVRALMDQALARAQPPIAASGGGAAIIKSVSARQRPRRPA